MERLKKALIILAMAADGIVGPGENQGNRVNAGCRVSLSQRDEAGEEREQDAAFGAEHSHLSAMSLYLIVRGVAP
ncbi:MAG: hypothetical protein LBF91_08995 [Azoarcus sp.]|jgi:hypothetical protein|nr:hypothetical protein [Azoarcus sp.]